MNTVLITAYAVNPYKGSEDGTGWNFIYQVAHRYRVVAITRKNNRAAIDKYREATSDDPVWQQLSFYYFDLPYWMRFWKRGPRGSGIYFYMWQWGIVPFIRRHGFTFDLAHSLNFHSDSHPNFLWRLGKPVIWGPLGHHPRVPSQFMNHYTWQAYVKDRLYFIGKKLVKRMDPFLRIAARKSAYILPINSDAAAVFKRQAHKLMIMPAIGAPRPHRTHSPDEELFIVLSVGRLVPMKGFDLAIESYLHFYTALSAEDRQKTALYLVGSGPEEEHLLDLARGRVGGDTVRLISWVTFLEMQQIYQQARVFLFPSHEGAGMVTVEAMAYGLPVVCLQNSGPGEIVSDACALTVPVDSYETTVRGLCEALHALHGDTALYNRMSQAAIKHFEATYYWPVKVARLMDLYEKALDHEYNTSTERNIIYSSAQ